MNLSASTSPQRILVIRLQHHGDVLLTTPMFAALKHTFPAAEVDAVVFAETAPMVASNPHLTTVWPLPRSKDAGKGWARLRKQSDLLAQIRQREYDWVLHLNDHWSGAWIARTCGAPVRVSYALPKRDNFLWRHIFPLRLPCASRGHMVERNLDFLLELGLPLQGFDAKCSMAFNDTDLATAKRKLSGIGIEDNYILVQPTSRWFFKCWEDDRFAQTITELAQEGHRIVLTAAPAEREMALISRLKTLAPHPNIASLAGQLTLPALAAAISKAKLFIGVDSAPMHMAAALDVPCVALFGASDVETWRPWSDKAIVIKASDYGPLISPHEVNTNTEERYLSNIPVQAVLDAARKLLAQQ